MVRTRKGRLKKALDTHLSRASERANQTILILSESRLPLSPTIKMKDLDDATYSTPMRASSFGYGYPSPLSLSTPLQPPLVLLLWLGMSMPRYPTCLSASKLASL